MQRRLAANGIRPINNIVDITNYVMEEYGQPMHAYDLDTIEDHQIVVRRFVDGEEFVTLDGQSHKMDNSMLAICDGKKPVGIAGIMGGENSMITDNVQTMLFEAACFDGTISVFPVKSSVCVPMPRVNLKRVWTRTMPSML